MKVRKLVICMLLSSIALVYCERKADREGRPTARAGTRAQIRAKGVCFARNDLFVYDPVGDSIILEHDLLSDSQHYIAACSSKYAPDRSWSAAGGGSILKDVDAYYIVLRQRGTMGYERASVALKQRDHARYAGGKEWQIWSSTDLGTWVKEWSLVRDSVDSPPLKILSIEGVSLKKFYSAYYLYISVLGSFTQKWAIYYVRSGSIEALRDSLKNGNSWHRIAVQGYKDPEVCECDGSYYAIWSHDTLRFYQPNLVKSSDPSFSSFEVLSLPAKPYRELFSSRCSILRGTIFYDLTSNLFIYWGSSYHRSEANIYWFWTISDDLKDWRYVDRKLVVADYAGMQHTARYFSYHALDDDRIVLIMEWDHDGDSSGDVFVWNYTDDPQGDTCVTQSGEVGK